MFVFERFFPFILSSFVFGIEPSLPQHSNIMLETGLVVSIRGWWWFVIKGIFFVITGIVILLGSVETYVGSGILVCISMLGIGISQLLFAITNRKILPGWGWTLASGMIDLAAGFYLALFPITMVATLPFFVGFWLLFRSSYFMGISLDLQSYRISGWGWLFAGGLVLMALSGITLYFPSDAAIGIVLLSGAAFVAGGVLSFVIAIKFREFDK
jgi:uncharacterized membrane protein HdeD (DUF308 family)